MRAISMLLLVVLLAACGNRGLGNGMVSGRPDTGGAIDAPLEDVGSPDGRTLSDAISCGVCNHECVEVGVACNGSAREVCTADSNGCRALTSENCTNGCLSGECLGLRVAAPVMTSPGPCDVLTTTDSAVLEFTVADLAGIDHFTFDVKQVAGCHEESAEDSLAGYPTNGIAETQKQYTLRTLSPGKWYKYSVESTASAGYLSNKVVGWFRTREPTTIVALSPSCAVVGTETTFTVVGTELPGTLRLRIPNCTVSTSTAGSATSRSLSCAPLAVGTVTAEVKDRARGNVLKTFRVGLSEDCLSCAGLAATCGPTKTEDCCETLFVPGGTFNRSNDPAYPATVSDFRLDRHEITVGRFRQFVEAGMGTQARPPAAGAGAHPLIPGSGWDASWNVSLPADTAALKTAVKCVSTFRTWTDTAGANESLPM
ncbi:MAG: hypothetical protein V2A73_07245, partial [Pseudomonadota bacterium]